MSPKRIFTVVVTGSRDYTDETKVRKHLAQLPRPARVIHGNYRGLDKLAARVATELGFEVKPVSADWEKHGRAAGPIRNRVMLNLRPNMVLAFPLEDSVGTWDTIEEARRRGIPVKVVDGERYEG
jgi:hypothetical protein